MKLKYNIKRQIKSIPLYDKNKLEEEKLKYDRKCKHCGWRNRIINRNNFVVCKNCKNLVFLSDYDEFKYRTRRFTNGR